MTPQTIGSMSIETIAERENMAAVLSWLLPTATQEDLARNRDWLDGRFMDVGAKTVTLAFHSYLLRTKHQNILIDTCNGNHKNRPTLPWQHELNAPYLENLARAGLKPEDIDLVLCTHLHTDHVGWNTRLLDGRWVPTFPKAKYLMARVEFDHFNRLHAHKPTPPVGGGSFEDSVLPVVAAGQAVFVETDHVIHKELDDGVWLEGAAGHTPGHVLVHAKAGDRHAVMSGDIFHHPIQIAEEALATGFDFDPPLAAATRRRLKERCAESGAILLPAHFPTPTAGRVIRVGAGFRLAWVEG